MADYMRISEVTDKYGLSRSTLLRYEEQGKIKPHKTAGGQRRYLSSDIERVMNSKDSGGTTEQIPQREYREFGISGPNRWGGTIYEEPLRELRGRKGRKILREMRLNDPVISAIFFAIENALRKATWRVAPVSESQPDKDAATFINECLNDMSFTWNDTLSFIFMFFEQGFSLTELIYKKRLGKNPPSYTSDPAPSKYNDGRVGWRKWAPRSGDTLVDGNEWKIDDHGGVEGINQDLGQGVSQFIPIDKLLLFRTTVAPNNNPEGLPIHRAMYLPWWYTTNIQEIEGIALERDLNGLPVIYLGTDATLSGPNSDYEMAKDLVTNIRRDEQEGVVIPKPKLGSGTNGQQGILLELLTSNGRRQFDTSAIIERYDKRKALSVLAQFIMLGMSNTGSFALSKEQGDLFILSATSWLLAVANVINQYAIPKLIDYNIFPGITGYPKLIPGAVGIPNLEEIATYVNLLVAKEVLTPDIELERHLRQLAGFPELKELIELDESGNPTSGIGRQNISLEKSALLVRRVGLATKALTDLGVLDEFKAQEILQPLVQELEEGIQNELVAGNPLGRRRKISPPTPAEDMEQS